MCLHNGVGLKQQRIFPILHLQTHARWYSYDCWKHIVIIHLVWSMRLLQALQEGRSSYVTWAGPSHSMELVLLSLCVCQCAFCPSSSSVYVNVYFITGLSEPWAQGNDLYLPRVSLMMLPRRGYIAVGVCVCLCVRVLETRVSHSFQSVSQCSRFSFLVDALFFSVIISHFCFVGCFLLQQSV